MTGATRPGGSASRLRSRTPAAWPRWTDRRGLAPAGGAGVRAGRLHGQPGHALAGDRGPARRVRGGDAFHYPLLRILVAARAHGLQAIDGPYAAIHDTDGLRRAAASVAALGYDGKWVLHPGQVDIVNAEFSPAQADYDRAELILDAYEYHTTVAGRGRRDARRRDDRRGLPQAGPGRRGPRPRGGAAPDDVLRAACRVTGSRLSRPARNHLVKEIARPARPTSAARPAARPRAGRPRSWRPPRPA